MNFFYRTLACVGVSTLAFALPASAAQGPSFKCSEKMASAVEDIICKNTELGALDRTLASAYSAALKNAGADSKALKAEQRGWIKGRDECWKSDDKPACISSSYRQRIIEVQSTYRLVTSTGPVTFDCGNNGIISATFFQTDPPSLAAIYKDQHSLMTATQYANGSRYQGQNDSFREHQGEARVTWGYGAPEMKCRKKS